MKKVAIFVEGETELEFLYQLLIEIAGRSRISIRTYRFQGGGRFTGTPRTSDPGIVHLQPNPVFEALIYNSTNDDRVISDIADQVDTLKNLGFGNIIGIRDLRGNQGTQPRSNSDLPFMEAANHQFEQSLSLPCKIIVSVMEMEAWFLAETNHYSLISHHLNETVIKANITLLGFDPYIDDLTLLQDPAESLHRLYRLGGESYSKARIDRIRTIQNLDYAHLYLIVRSKISQLHDLLNEIDSFVS